jgi:hypothetical protein
MSRTVRVSDSRSRRSFFQGIAGLGISVGGLALLAGCGGRGASIAPAAGDHPDSDVSELRPLRRATLVERGFTQRPAYALQAMQQVPYSKWRDYDAEDTVRFYALRLQEAGMIKSGPNTIIEKGTDWRFFNELRQELKT